MKLSITIEGMMGLTWDRWKQLIENFEGLQVLAEDVLPYISN